MFFTFKILGSLFGLLLLHLLLIGLPPSAHGKIDEETQILQDIGWEVQHLGKREAIKHWLIPRDATVCFLNGTIEEQDLVKSLIEKHYHAIDMAVRFRFVPPSDPDPIFIRVKFTTSGKSSFTYVGERFDNPVVPTMVLQLAGRSNRYKQMVILHEFGHALGMDHHHQHPDSGIKWNEDRILPAYRGQFCELKQFQVPVPYDRDSIMHYEIPKGMTTNLTEDIINNCVLSVGDKKHLMLMHPIPSKRMESSLVVSRI